MAGLVPAIPLRQAGYVMAAYYVYFIASRPGGALYVGITNDLVRRVYEHRSKVIKGHTERYNIAKLVYFEVYDDVRLALQREKNIKHWPRVWKTNLILEANPSGAICTKRATAPGSRLHPARAPSTRVPASIRARRPSSCSSPTATASR